MNITVLNVQQLDPKRLGLAAGIFWGVSMLVMTLVSVYTGYATAFLNGMASIYPGYAISLTGSLIGLVYGLLDGFVDLYLVAWLYNFFGKRRL
ncbi:MAG: bacteriophage holin [Candidatus Bathyarchaeia archaeon]